MTIILNGSPRVLPDQSDQPLTLSQLLAILGLDSRPVLIEKNGAAILQREFAQETVVDQDRIEIVRMVAGG